MTLVCCQGALWARPSGLARRVAHCLAGLESSGAPGRTLIPAVLVYVGCLTAFGLVALGWGPLHHDTTELWAWGKEFQLGYAKHPPFSAWLAGGWFTLLPRTSGSAYFLASLNVAVALAGVWMLAGRFLGIRGRLASVLFLVLTPSFSIWALKFNVNAPLISIWPWAAYFFLGSVDSRRIDFSVVAGVLGGLALLTKYYSIVLLATFFMVAILHPARRQYFASAAPYISVATGLGVIMPHGWWLITSGFPTFDYAISKTQFDLALTRWSAVKTIVGGVGSLGIAALAYWFAFGSRVWNLVERAVSGSFEKRNAWLICLTHSPLLLTIVAYVVVNVRITGGFLLPVFYSTPTIFLAVARAEITLLSLGKLLVFAVATWLAMLAASPFLAHYAFARSQDWTNGPNREVALEATRLWNTTFGRPLGYVAGEFTLAIAVTFYSPDGPSYVVLDRPSYSPWASLDQVKRGGLIVVCPETDGGCIRMGTDFAGDRGIRRAEEVSLRFRGRRGSPQRFVFVMRPPDL